jgi:hypothetical protein
MEIKSRKPAAAAPQGGALASEDDVGGAEAAVDVLNMEDDDGAEDAPLPDPFEYLTDSED